MGVKKKYHHKGIDALMYYETFKRAMRNGIHGGESSWILEDNFAIRNALENWGAAINKTYGIYGKSLR